MAACFRLVSPLKIQEQQQEEEKGCLMVMADPSDLGHGKKEKRGGASRWRVCYQWGLPTLVS